MKEFSQPGDHPPNIAGPFDCATVDSWLTEAAEKNLSPEINLRMREHAAGCAGCREKLAQAMRGREWLMVLKQEALEPSPDLLAKILARTSGAHHPDASSAPLPTPDNFALLFGRAGESSSPDGPFANVGDASPGHPAIYPPAEYLGVPSPSSKVPAWQRASLIGLRHKVFEPRLALVAAMAFFSISLTLNLVGIHPTNLRTSDLQPQNLRRTVTRHYAEANAHVVRYYENLRIVYEVEARVQQLRRAAETTPMPQPASGNPHQGSSDSSRDPGRNSNPQRDGMSGSKQPAERNATLPDPVPLFAGPRMDVSLHLPDRPKMRPSQHTGRAGSLLAALFAWKLEPQALLCPIPTTSLSGVERRLA